MTDNSSGKDEKGLFLPGNRFWEARSTAGPKPKFANPDDLWAVCAEYFNWVYDNPIISIELAKHQGDAKQVKVPKMQAMTIGGLCIFLDIDQSTWRSWRNPESVLSSVVNRVEEIIRAQKFAGAAADQLNPNIIARDLGLVDNQKQTHDVSDKMMEFVKELHDLEEIEDLVPTQDESDLEAFEASQKKKP